MSALAGLIGRATARGLSLDTDRREARGRGRPWALLIAGLLSLLVALGAMLLLEGRALAPPPRSSGGSVRQELPELPAAARGVVSATLGAADARYAVEPSPGGGLRAGNPAQRFSASFGRRGVLVRDGRSRLGLRLAAVGYGSSLLPVAAAAPAARANRVLYRSAGVEQWYVNGPLGLEQGFDLSRAPGRAAPGPLTLALASTGGLRSSLLDGGRVVSFKGRADQGLRYGGLRAVDAQGKVLRSWLELAGGRLMLRVDDRGASYPLRIDPFLEQQELKETGAAGGNVQFGAALALSGDGNTAIAGAPNDNKETGAAWVFVRNGHTWEQQQEIKPTGPATPHFFGASVGLSANGNVAVIGSPASGEAVIAKRIAGKWEIRANLTPGTAPDSTYGVAVAISADGETALVGDRTLGKGAGAGFVFAESGGKWEQQAELIGSEVTGFANLGISVALSANGSTALLGGSADNSFVGAAWVFTRYGTSWEQQGPKLIGGGEVGAAEFGESAALSADGSTALVGGPQDEGGTGAVWAFARTATSWAQQGSKLESPIKEANSHFGTSLGLSSDGNTAVAGEDSLLNEQQDLVVLLRSGTTWSATEAKLPAVEEPETGPVSAAVSGDGTTALLGAPPNHHEAGQAWAFARPAVKTEPAIEVTNAGARLTATIYPAGTEIKTCKFELGTTTAYGSTAACAVPGPVSTPVVVGSSIGLPGNTTFHYRIVIESAAGTFTGADEVVTTLEMAASASTKVPTIPATATDGAVSATASGGVGTITVGKYSPTPGGPVLPSGAGGYIDVYRSTSSSFTQVVVKDCELAGAQAAWWYSPMTGWKPIAPSTAIFEGGCATITITEATSPSLKELIGTRIKFGEPPGSYGQCRKSKDDLYSDSSCLTLHGKNGVPDDKGKYEWYPAPVGCFPQKKGLFGALGCEGSKVEKKGKADGKYERGNDSFTSSAGETRLEISGVPTVTCSSMSGSGELLAPFYGTETLTLHGCAQAGKPCSTETITTTPLEVVSVRAGGSYYLILTAADTFARLSCSGATYALNGGAAGRTVGTVNTMSTSSTVEFAPTVGQQELKAQSASGTELALKLTSSITTTSAQPLELDTAIPPA